MTSTFLHEACSCGEISEQNLSRAYDALTFAPPDLAVPLQCWAALAPESHAAQIQLERAKRLAPHATLAFTHMQALSTPRGQRAWAIYHEGLHQCPGSLQLREDEKLRLYLREGWRLDDQRALQ